ncbi:MAG: hypothetical protein AMS15_08145, partial [Planctomycetes bacterium DG_23]
GRLDLRRDTPSIKVDEVIPIAEAVEKLSQSLTIKINLVQIEEEALLSLREILARHKGRKPVYLELTTHTGREVHLAAGSGYRVRPNEELLREVEGLVGEGSIVSSSKE